MDKNLNLHQELKALEMKKVDVMSQKDNYVKQKKKVIALHVDSMCKNKHGATTQSEWRKELGV